MKRLGTPLALVALVTALFLGVPAARAATGPALSVKAHWGDTDLGAPGAGLAAGQGELYLHLRNAGDAAPTAPVRIEDRFPPGVTITNVDWHAWRLEGSYAPNMALEPPGPYCPGSIGTRTLTCTIPAQKAEELLPPLGRFPSALLGVFPPNFAPPLYVDVQVAPGAGSPAVNTATVSGGGSAPFTDTDPISLGSTPSSFGIVPGSFEADVFSAPFPFGVPSRQAGAHPFEQRVNFDLNEEAGYYECVGTAECEGVGASSPYTAPAGSLRDAEVTLPRGMIGNPEATPKCDPVDFASPGSTPNSTGCPADTQVGYMNVWFEDRLGEAHGEVAFFVNSNGALLAPVAIYNLKPPKGTLVDLGFNAGGYVQGHIYAELDPARDYAIRTLTPNVSDLLAVRGSEVVIWGVPADPAHDRFRFYPTKQTEGTREVALGASWGTAPIRPFFTDPMDCGVENGGMRIRVDSYERPDVWSAPQEATPVNVTGCEDPRFRFEPDISLEPTDRHAGAPTGLEVKLQVPQRNDEVKNVEELYAQNGSVKGIATPPIKKTVVTLPEGMTLNPSAGQGLGGCSLAQLGMSAAGVPDEKPVECPADSAIGTLILHSPDLPENEPLTGRAYIARQGENPFGSLFALYLVLENKERGVLVKLAGKIELDPSTGQIKTTFDNIPQFPVSDFQLVFKGGIRAALVNPSTCGPKTITAEYFSWQDPNTPHVATQSYTITQRPDGSPCLNNLNERPFAPQLASGTLSNSAGWFSPFTLDLTRTDEDQEISSLSVTLPDGLSAKLAGVAQCPESGIAQAENPGRTGSEELANPSCPAGSQIGTVLVGTGTGSSLTWVPGKLYFAGPYKGAPFSLVAITPSVVGPYDLGTVAVRSALYIDPTTAQATVKTDPLPQILKGIPVRIRDVRVTVDRPEFTFNPTSCNELHVTGGSTSDYGVNVSLSNRFQAANCGQLAFKPSFKVSTSGKTSRKNGASLRVLLTYPKAAWGTQANIAKVKVDLPKQLPSRLTTLQKACTEHQFEADPASCPAASRVGIAKAITPILPVALEGPAYFVSHGGAKFPELIIVLQGDGVRLDLHGETFISKAGITSSTFPTVPDAPVGSFELTLPEGANSALAANASLCTASLAMPTAFTAQNGAIFKQSTQIAVTGCKPAIVVLGRRVGKRTATLTVRVPAAGRLRASGAGLTSASRRVSKAGVTTISVSLSSSERRFLARHPGRKLKARIHLRLAPVRGKTLTATVAVLIG